MELELHQIRYEEVRRGWVRIHESRRVGIRAGELVKLSGPSGHVLRVVYGLPDDYRVGDRLAQENWVCMDEPTRDAIELKDSPFGSMVTISVDRITRLRRPIGWLCDSLVHPEIPLRIGSWLALVSFLLGIISIVLGVISVVK